MVGGERRAAAARGRAAAALGVRALRFYLAPRRRGPLRQGGRDPPAVRGGGARRRGGGGAGPRGGARGTGAAFAGHPRHRGPAHPARRTGAGRSAAFGDLPRGDHLARRLRELGGHRRPAGGDADGGRRDAGIRAGRRSCGPAIRPRRVPSKSSSRTGFRPCWSAFRSPTAGCT